MEYYIVDKCYNVEDTQLLVINCGNNKNSGTKLEAGSVSRQKDKCEAKYTLCDFDMWNSGPIKYDDNDRANFFNSLYISNFNVFYNVETDPYIDTLNTNNLSVLSKIKRHNCYKRFPTIMITYEMSSSYTFSKQEYERICPGQEKVISIKPDNFENSIDLCLTANTEKHMYNDSKFHFKCDVHTKMLKSSIITYNGDKYIFDPKNIEGMYCVCIRPNNTKNTFSETYVWKFFCIARIYYVNKPTVTKVTEEIFKKTSKCNADIVISKNKTYLMKNTSNSNVIFDYSNPKVKKGRAGCCFSTLDNAINYTSTCSNCKNCYNCYKCDNCEDCEECNNCIECVSCNDCNNCEYCDHMQYADMSLFSIDENDKEIRKSEKIEDINIYTKYVKKYVN